MELLHVNQVRVQNILFIKLTCLATVSFLQHRNTTSTLENTEGEKGQEGTGVF